MLLNPLKSKCMITATRQRDLNKAELSIYKSNNKIEQVPSHKLLGMVVDSELKWLRHLEILRIKLARNLYLLSNLKNYVDSEALKMFFHAHILPHVNYVSPVWDGCAEDHKIKTNSLYRRASKLILKEQIDAGSKMRNFGFLSMEEHLLDKKVLLVFKTLNDQAPNYLEALLCRATVRYSSLNLIKPLSRIDLFQTSLSFSGADYWNKLPYELKNTKTISCFKRNLKKHINILNLKNMQQQF